VFRKTKKRQENKKTRGPLAWKVVNSLVILLNAELGGAATAFLIASCRVCVYVCLCARAHVHVHHLAYPCPCTCWHILAHVHACASACACGT